MTAPNLGPRPAIGFLREDIAGRQAIWDCRDITLYAGAHNLALLHTLQISPTVFDPTLRLMNYLRAHDVAVVITPAQAHVAGRTAREITEKWELHVLESQQVYLPGHKWPTSIEVP